MPAGKTGKQNNMKRVNKRVNENKHGHPSPPPFPMAPGSEPGTPARSSVPSPPVIWWPSVSSSKGPVAMLIWLHGLRPNGWSSSVAGGACSYQTRHHAEGN
ncbi:unnamed protein product [Lota lota]